MKDICGTPTYIAPEILNNEEYDTKCDIFAVGSIMYNLISGRYLFYGNERENVLMLNKQCNLEHTSKYLTQISNDAKDLLFKLLNKNQEKRLNAREAL